MESSERNSDIVDTQENSAERTFTQDEVNEIVRNRLAREREKTSSTVGKEAELAGRELRLMAREKLFESNLPSSLADVLRYTDDTTLDVAIKEIQKLIKATPVNEVDQSKPASWGQRQSARSAGDKDPYRSAMGLK